MAQAIYRKYRPRTFNDVSGQEHVSRTVQNQLREGNIGHAYLFSGPRGIGKTTIARLIGKALNCSERKEGESEPCNHCKNCEEANEGRAIDIIEIDAASNTGVDNVRENIIEAVRFSPTTGTYKVYIIDEVHMLSTSAFNALLKTIEEPPEHAIFILATTELHKIPDTIISRCMRFDFKRLPAAEIMERLQAILSKENIQADEGVLKAIIRTSEGCLRDAESLLGQLLALGEKHITKDHAELILPMMDIRIALDIIAAGTRCQTNTVLELLQKYIEQGASIKHLHNTLIDLVRDLLFISLGGPKDTLLDDDTQKALDSIAATTTTTKLTALIDALIEAKGRPKHDAIPQLTLELAFLKVCAGERETVHYEEVPQEPIVTSTESMNKEANVEVQKPKQNTELDTVSDQSKEGDAIQKNEDQAVVETGKIIRLDDLISKWQRCCEVVSKKSISLPLVLKTAKPFSATDKIVKVMFDHKFHFETINTAKNLGILASSINEVMQSNIHVEPVFQQPEDEKKLNELATAFGGKVID